MKLNPGTRLGPYEVVAAIGAGAIDGCVDDAACDVVELVSFAVPV